MRAFPWQGRGERRRLAPLDANRTVFIYRRRRSSINLPSIANSSIVTDSSSSLPVALPVSTRIFIGARIAASRSIKRARARDRIIAINQSITSGGASFSQFLFRSIRCRAYGASLDAAAVRCSTRFLFLIGVNDRCTRCSVAFFRFPRAAPSRSEPLLSAMAVFSRSPGNSRFLRGDS